MTLRLSDEQAALLRSRAEFEGRSMQEVAKSAIEEYLESHIRADLIGRILDEELPRYAEAMRRLAE
jgi:predicted transcriptional regulator